MSDALRQDVRNEMLRAHRALQSGLDDHVAEHHEGVVEALKRALEHLHNAFGFAHHPVPAVRPNAGIGEGESEDHPVPGDEAQPVPTTAEESSSADQDQSPTETGEQSPSSPSGSGETPSEATE
jgi:hypothetical protein